MKKLLIFIVAVLLCVNITAQSDQDRGHPIKSGMYVSMSAGLHFLSINDDIINGQYSNIKMKGMGGGSNYQIGVVVKDNFIIHGDILTIVSSSVNLVADGNTIGTISGDNSVGMMAFGCGATYYMSQNIFITAALGMGRFNVTVNSELGSSQIGFASFLKVGKEWWISKNWDIGCSFIFNYMKVNSEVGTTAEELSGLAVGVLFNATFN